MTTITETISALLSHDIKMETVSLIVLVTLALMMAFILTKYMVIDGIPIIIATSLSFILNFLLIGLVYVLVNLFFGTVHRGGYYVTASRLRDDAISCVGENSVNLCVVEGGDIEKEHILISGTNFFDSGNIKFSIVAQNKISDKPYFFIKDYDSNDIYAIPVTAIRHFKGVVNRARLIEQEEQEKEDAQQKELDEINAKTSFTNSNQ